jgi:sterol desaturase/sphingolipid hydroxylase (fatty acid hydroxylase superfamily)
MSTGEFVTSVSLILVVMALLAVAELALPMAARLPARRGRRTANVGLMILTLGLNWALTSAAAVLALALSLDGPGHMARLGVPMAVQIVVGVAVLDFGFGYLAHRTMHMTPTLWRAHRVHHSDPFVDVTTTYRTHPIEVVWRFLFVIVPVWVLGLPAAAVVLHRVLSAINGLLEHANIRLWQPLDRAVSLFWVTPHMHKIHHSRDAVETDSNYGNIFSLYDRILRTFTPTDRAFTVTYGLDDADPPRSTSLRGLLSMPFQAGEAQQSAPSRQIPA